MCHTRNREMYQFQEEREEEFLFTQKKTFRYRSWRKGRQMELPTWPAVFWVSLPAADMVLIFHVFWITPEPSIIRQYVPQWWVLSTSWSLLGRLLTAFAPKPHNEGIQSSFRGAYSQIWWPVATHGDSMAQEGQIISAVFVTSGWNKIVNGVQKGERFFSPRHWVEDFAFLTHICGKTESFKVWT